MARYFLNPECSLDWLLRQDSRPDILPKFPDDSSFGLVVAYLASGKMLAEVVPSPAVFVEICGPGLPLGRLYFHISKNRLYSVCDGLTSETFKN